MMHGGDGWIGHDGWGWGGWALMGVAMIVFWAVVLTLMVLAIRYLISARGSGTFRQADSATPPEGVLAQRYARGEIDDDEYRQRIAVLRAHR